MAEEGLHLALSGTGIDEHGVEAVVVLLGRKGVHREGNTGWSSDGGSKRFGEEKYRGEKIWTNKMTDLFLEKGR